MFPPIFVENTKIIYGYSFVPPLSKTVINSKLFKDFLDIFLIFEIVSVNSFGNS